MPTAYAQECARQKRASPQVEFPAHVHRPVALDPINKQDLTALCLLVRTCTCTELYSYDIPLFYNESKGHKKIFLTVGTTFRPIYEHNLSEGVPLQMMGCTNSVHWKFHGLSADSLSVRTLIESTYCPRIFSVYTGRINELSADFSVYLHWENPRIIRGFSQCTVLVGTCDLR